ncbi:flagellar basal body-associated FliL family protein [Cellulomonas marina]|uniref:Flagellar protein FliL n=1 Tax=Cellulomonas marina TaxID=988821 RepID=A0A1I1B1S9_9CELL|nr:flagellar basal body-associated FliL family protein [Cellulomonas marina]GIG30634.1 hypothetical protein Cma02nite_32340 [Cellulomonas marina]SFB42493.1 flagellar FliL protein [Cellulomonas marina]
MPTEQRIVSDKKIGGGKIGGGGAAPAEEAEAPAKKGKKKLLLLVVIGAVLGLAAGAYFFLFAPSGEEGAEGEAAAEVVEEPVELGEVLTVEPISINLAEGHYLRLGLALQLTATAVEPLPDPSVALDKAIALYSGRPMAEVNDGAKREELKAELTRQLAETYPDAIAAVYLTTYVTQ